MKLSDLKLNEKNPRSIKDEKFVKLCDSIKSDPEFLTLRPIIIDKDNVVVAGNMRYRALTHLGYKDIPEGWVQSASYLTTEQLRKFVVVDNLPYGDWDWDVLASDYELDELTDWGMDIPDFVNAKEATEDDYEIPDEIKTDIVLGDLFTIGAHRLLCGDSTDSGQVERLMDGEKADMVFTDPPYNVAYNTSKNPRWRKDGATIKNDDMTTDAYLEWMEKVAQIIKDYNKGCIYVCGAPGLDGRTAFMVLDKMLHNSTTIIWKKDIFTLGRGKYQNQYEPIWFGWVKGGEGFTTQRNLSNVWDFERPRRSDEHPTMKPIPLVANAVNHASRNEDRILDLFLGSGTTMVAAHQLNRKCYGIEIDPKYCQVIVDRMLKLDPTLEIKKNGEVYSKQDINSEATA